MNRPESSLRTAIATVQHGQLGDAVAAVIRSCQASHQPEEIIVSSDGRERQVVRAVQWESHEFVVTIRELPASSSEAARSFAPDPVEEADPGVPLTHRQLMVLQLMALGITDKEIAQRLKISPFTASKHVGNILERLQVASRTEATVRALQGGLIRAAS